MSRLDDLKKSFFEESGEQLGALMIGLTDLREGSGSEHAVDAALRAVNAIKEGAGIFGFERLFEFAHMIESVLDSIRRGSRAASPRIVDVLLTAKDILADLAESARVRVELPEDYEYESRSELERLVCETKACSEAGKHQKYQVAMV